MKVMVSTLHKEMSMMQVQLTKYKEAACEVHQLRAKIHSLAGILDRKVSSYISMSALNRVKLMERYNER